MFRHSVRVPRLYKVAAKIAKDVKEGVGSIKQLVYENQKKHPRIKSLYALIATLFQRSEEIEGLLKRSQFLIKEPRSDPWLIKVLIVELLWGRKRLSGESKPEKTVLAYEQVFKAHLNDVCLATEADDSSKVVIKPRYVRVNTLSSSLNEAVDGFRDEGWDLCKFLDKTNYEGFLSKITSLAENEFLVDIHVPNLLIFPPKTEFYRHPAYKNGSIVLQDKASCLPVHILGPKPGSIVLDMCAAPGMKTTQVAAAINNEGTIYAVESNPKRFQTLNKIIESSGATCVKTVNRDVLTCGESDFPGVQYILVDPSCTGSGMSDRQKFEQKPSDDRMQRLAGFQIKILRSALTKYPDARIVVYSTCSLFPEENEDVVRQVLETNSTFKLVPAKRFVNDTWKNFGSPDFGDIGKYCLYAKPDEDFTNGFFVAVFERLEEGENNSFFNTKIYNYKKHVQSQEKRRNKNPQEIDEEFGEEIQQNQESTFVNADEHENTVAGNNIGRNIKRKRKKEAQNGFIGNDEQTRIEGKSNVDENIKETGNKSYQSEDMEGVNKKRKKGDVVEKSENIEAKSKKKRCKKSHSEVLENSDEEKLMVKHKKKKNKELYYIDSIRTVDTSDMEGGVKETGFEFSAMETQKKKAKKGTEPHSSKLELIEENYIIKKKKKRRRRNKELESTDQCNDEVSVMENRNSKKKKNKESYVKCTEHVAEVNEKGSLEENGISGPKTQKKAGSTEQQDRELRLTEESDNIFKKQKKKKHRRNKELEAIDENNDVVIITKDSGGFPAAEVHISKKKKKHKESHIQFTGTVAESYEKVNPEKNGIEFSSMETETKKAKRNTKQHKSELELIEETDITIEKKKKKRRRNNELGSTVENNDEVCIVNDSSEFPATQIPIIKKKMKNKESQFLESVSGNSHPASIKNKKAKLSVNEKNVEKTESNISSTEVEAPVVRKKKKKISNC